MTGSAATGSGATAGTGSSMAGASVNPVAVGGSRTGSAMTGSTARGSGATAGSTSRRASVDARLHVAAISGMSVAGSVTRLHGDQRLRSDRSTATGGSATTGSARPAPRRPASPTVQAGGRERRPGPARAPLALRRRFRSGVLGLRLGDRLEEPARRLATGLGVGDDHVGLRPRPVLGRLLTVGHPARRTGRTPWSTGPPAEYSCVKTYDAVSGPRRRSGILADRRTRPLSHRSGPPVRRRSRISGCLPELLVSTRTRHVVLTE